MLYFWLSVCVLMLFWGLLTRYYQRFSKRRTYYRALLLPVLLGGFVSVRNAARPLAAPEALEEAAALAAAALLILLTLRATFYMLRRG